jgi:hypothetical protein
MNMERTMPGDQIESVGGCSEVVSDQYCVQELLNELRADPSQTNPDISTGFEGLLGVAESLPLTTDEFGFARNWITSARQLWEQGKAGAALYQIRQVCLRLGLLSVLDAVGRDSA